MSKLADIIEAAMNCDEFCRLCEPPNPCDVLKETFDPDLISRMNAVCESVRLLCDRQHARAVEIKPDAIRAVEALDALLEERGLL